jgi:hypothetical protein
LRAGRKSVRHSIAIFRFLFRYFSRLDQTNFSRFGRTLTLVSTVGFAIFATQLAASQSSGQSRAHQASVQVYQWLAIYPEATAKGDRSEAMLSTLR